MRINEILTEDVPKSSGDIAHRSQRSRENYDGDLYNYSFGSRDISSFLHKKYRGKNPRNVEFDVPDLVKGIDSVFSGKKYALKRTLKVYSGVHESPANIWTKYGADTNKPVRVHLPAFTSTTTSWQIAVDFSGRARVNLDKHTPVEIIGGTPNKNPLLGLQILYIEVPKGYNAVSIKDISNQPHEDEILLPRGLDVIINPRPLIKYDYGLPIFVWMCKVVGNNPIQLDLSE